MGRTPVMDHAGRRERVRAAVHAGEPAAQVLLVTDPVNVRYLSGFRGSNGQVLLGATAEDDRLITDERYRARAAVEAPELGLVCSRDPVGAVIEHVAAGVVVGVEADHLTWAAATTAEQRLGEAGLQVVATTGVVARAREVKDDAELARLQEACALTVAALAWLVEERLAIGVREVELATLLERRFVDLGADGVAFPSIVASGPNGAVPHHEAGQRQMAAGDLVTIDCGALVDGYHADCTRTFAVGAPDPQLAEVYEVVRTAQAAGAAAVRAGVSAGEVDASAREVIDAAGFGERFVHGTGHGVGLVVHEAPAVARGSAATLSAGNVLTVEPGIYLPGRGGVRIEDTLVVTADGPAQPLTDAPRELRVL